MFSAHSPEVLPPGVVMPESGFLFHASSESGSLDTSDYGSTWVTEAFVRVLAGAGVDDEIAAGMSTTRGKPMP